MASDGKDDDALFADEMRQQQEPGQLAGEEAAAAQPEQAKAAQAPAGPVAAAECKRKAEEQESAGSGPTAAGDIFECEHCEEALPLKMLVSKGGQCCKECKKMIDLAYRDAQRNCELVFWGRIRTRRADFKRFLRLYSRVTGRGKGRGRTRTGAGLFDWARYQAYFKSSRYSRSEVIIRRKPYAGFVKYFTEEIGLSEREAQAEWEHRKSHPDQYGQDFKGWRGALRIEILGEDMEVEGMSKERGHEMLAGTKDKRNPGEADMAAFQQQMLAQSESLQMGSVDDSNFLGKMLSNKSGNAWEFAKDSVIADSVGLLEIPDGCLVCHRGHDCKNWS